jgi:hypothetical protein
MELQARITWDGNTTKVPAPARCRVCESPGMMETHGRRQGECNITVLLVLADASRLGDGRIRSPAHSSVASNNASTPNIRRMPAVSGDNRGRRKRTLCSGVVVRIRNSTGDPSPALRPPLKTSNTTILT